MLGVLAAIPGAIVGYDLTGPAMPQGIEREAELQRELDEIRASTELPPECIKSEDETVEERLDRVLGCRFTEEAPTARAEALKYRLDAIAGYREQYPGPWYQSPQWLRATLTTLGGAATAFVLVFGGIQLVVRLVSWIIAGFN